MKFGKFLTSGCLALLFAGMSIVLPTTGLAKTTPAPTPIPASINTQNNQLPRKDIQRFVTSIALIHHYYIKKISNNKLFDDAIRGMVASLDPHSSYLNASDLKELKTTVILGIDGCGNRCGGRYRVNHC